MLKLAAQVFIAMTIANILAILILPGALSFLTLLASIYLAREPISVFHSLFRIKADLKDSMMQFTYHRMAFDKALSKLQELILMLNAGYIPRNREQELAMIIKSLEQNLHRSADRLVRQLGAPSGSQTGPSCERSTTMHNLKLAYNDTLRYFYAFYQTRIVHFYLQQGNSIELLQEKLEANVTAFSQETIKIHE